MAKTNESKFSQVYVPDPQEIIADLNHKIQILTDVIKFYHFQKDKPLLEIDKVSIPGNRHVKIEEYKTRYIVTQILDKNEPLNTIKIL